MSDTYPEITRLLASRNIKLDRLGCTIPTPQTIYSSDLPALAWLCRMAAIGCNHIGRPDQAEHLASAASRFDRGRS